MRKGKKGEQPHDGKGRGTPRPPIKRKGSNGSGTIAPDRSGKRYKVGITAGKDETGKPIRLWRSAHSLTEAQQRLHELLAQRVSGHVTLSNKSTVREIAESWLAKKALAKNGQIRYSTSKRREYHLKHVLDLIGDQKVQKLTEDDIIVVLRTLATMPLAHGRPMAAVSLKHTRSHLRSIFQHAVEKRIIPINPVPIIRSGSAEAYAAGTPLTEQQVYRLCEVGEALYKEGMLRLWPAIFVALFTGMRRGELHDLQWQDVDFADNRIHIRRTCTKAERGYGTGPTKTQASERAIPMSALVKDMLKQQQKRHIAERNAQKMGYHREQYVFSTLSGARTNPDNLYRAVALLQRWADPINLQVVRGQRTMWHGVPRQSRERLQAVVRGGEALPRFSPHDLRHTYATLMLRQREAVEVVSSLLGHASVGITMDVYRKVRDDEKRATVRSDILGNRMI